MFSAALAAACGAVQPTIETAAPLNGCPQFSCSSYVANGPDAMATTAVPAPACTVGACLVPAPAASMNDLVVVVDLPEDSFFAPGTTCAVPFASLLSRSTEICPAPTCGHLPSYVEVNGAYVMSPRIAQLVNWNLGNSGGTSLPVTVTYRPLWTPLGASTPVDAASLGLPLAPVMARTLVNASAPGPGGGPGVGFNTFIQGAVSYEQTIQPNPPFDQAFAPQIRVMTPSAGFEGGDDPNGFDATTENSVGHPTLPTFDISRNDGLDGWTAYLRDAATKRTLSSVAPLSGTTSSGVVLATNHVGNSGVDPLFGAELVIAPPATLVAPKGVFAPQANVLPTAEPYPDLPAVQAVDGVVIADDGSAIDADVVFEAFGITNTEGQLNTRNFDFSASASARVDPTSTLSAYAASLPQGQYCVYVRPLDAVHAVTEIDGFMVGPSGALSSASLTAGPVQTIRGVATVADGRPLAGATVEAIPTACLDAVACPNADPSSCMPRSVEARTDAVGRFALSVDPGSFQVRVRPADGTRFPWMTQSVRVVAAPVDLVFVVPAPFYAGLRLSAPADNFFLVHAVVRIFSAPGAGPAVELGQAITDTGGNYAMYLAPTSE